MVPHPHTQIQKVWTKNLIPNFIIQQIQRWARVKMVMECQAPCLSCWVRCQASCPLQQVRQFHTQHNGHDHSMTLKSGNMADSTIMKRNQSCSIEILVIIIWVYNHQGKDYVIECGHEYDIICHPKPFNVCLMKNFLLHTLCVWLVHFVCQIRKKLCAHVSDRLCFFKAEIRVCYRRLN